MTFRVLNVVTNQESRFFSQQVSTLEDRGLESTTVSVPTPFVAGESQRSVVDYLRLLPPTIRKSFGDYDLLHANSGLTAPAAVLQPNLPTVVSLWGTDLFGPYGPVTQRFSRLCDSVVVMSEEMAAHYGGSCYVIPHGVDLERFSPERQSDASRELGWSADARHVLFPYPEAREVKNYPRAERIVSRARRRIDDPVKIHTVSGVPHSRMPTYMNASDALLLTSRREGSPNSVKEAMACNLPVVATPVGDVPERLEGVSPSGVADDDDALVDELVDVLEAGQQSNGRKHVRQIGVDQMADRLIDVYERVVDE
jgi:glycosyltransferase involved in cell wall biosynthesis